MNWLWALQAVIDVTVLFGMVLWWMDRRRSTRYSPEDRLTTALAWLQAKAGEWEEQVAYYREANENQLKGLMRICEGAGRILARGQQSSLPPSQEECELKAVLRVEKEYRTVPTERIPTLAQLEQTKERLKSDLSPDLRLILKDQLA